MCFLERSSSSIFQAAKVFVGFLAIQFAGTPYLPCMMFKILLSFPLLFMGFSLWAQAPQFTRQDTLRGSITPERAWWDLTYYHLDIAVDPDKQTIYGSNTIQYRVLEPGRRLQVDLQPPMHISRVTQAGKPLEVEKDGNAWFVTLSDEQQPGEIHEILVEYGGTPTVARRPPWDGGLTWEKDARGKPFIATSCQGAGASLWWPCKDHMYDEPDSMLISVNVPEDLMDVSNGRLRAVEDQGNGTRTFHWFVNNPINNYGVNINIADYAHFSEVFPGEKGGLDCDYYVLRENLDKAREQFKQVPMMLEAFEYWFGPYPFYEDGFKLVEVPYLGMEHQSSVTYGNRYMNGYLGRDGSLSGWGLKFDFIIIHESGHEWFANNITYKDAADMWVHEGFTNYSESLYLDYHYGTQAANEYVQGIRTGIRNNRPIIGIYNVNYEGSGDMYNKGGNLLHTLRQIVNDDEKWRQILRGMNRAFYHQTVTSKQIEDYLSAQIGMDLSAFFDQFLRDTRIPVLEYFIGSGPSGDHGLFYRWQQNVPGLSFPVRVKVDGETTWITPESGWQMLDADEPEQFTVDPNFYIVPYEVFPPRK